MKAKERLAMIRDWFDFGDYEVEATTKSEIEEKFKESGDKVATSQYTFVIGEDSHVKDSERVVWVDPEGLTFGWKFLLYEKNDYMDYQGLSDELYKEFLQELERVDKNIQLYLFGDEKHLNVLFLNLEELEEDKEVYSYIYGFHPTLLEALSEYS